MAEAFTILNVYHFSVSVYPTRQRPLNKHLINIDRLILCWSNVICRQGIFPFVRLFSFTRNTFVTESVNSLWNFKSVCKLQCHYAKDLCKYTLHLLSRFTLKHWFLSLCQTLISGHRLFCIRLLGLKCWRAKPICGHFINLRSSRETVSSPLSINKFTLFDSVEQLFLITCN